MTREILGTEENHASQFDQAPDLMPSDPIEQQHPDVSAQVWAPNCRVDLERVERIAIISRLLREKPE